MANLNVNDQELHWIRGCIQEMYEELLDHDSFGRPIVNPLKKPLENLLYKIGRCQ